MLENIKKTFPNIYIILISLAIAIWFSGCSRLIDNFFDDSLKSGIILCCLSLFILYLDDGKLNELHDKDSNVTAAAALMSSGYD
tara:strand:+ start:719 stop:970 length:252 start_codon:yes stop_codon:yes gene_type:complete